jgi:hypothetical protein
MRCSIVRPHLLMVLGLSLAVHLLPAPALAATARGVMLVSFTVLPVCQVSTTSRVRAAASTADITCPTALPFRVSLADAAPNQIGRSDPTAGAVFTGTQRAILSQLADHQLQESAAGPAILTISY